MQINKFLPILISPLFLVACGEGESAVSKKINFRVSGGSTVLPTTLQGAGTPPAGTCLQNDIEGPRVRMRASINWTGTEYGNLVPFVLVLEINNSSLDGAYRSAIGPEGDLESISGIFGASTDFIEPDPDAVLVSSTCFLDYGGLPKPKNELTGRRELKVRGKLIMTGVARTDAGEETPFVKEALTEMTYIAGSIPVQE